MLTQPEFWFAVGGWLLVLAFGICLCAFSARRDEQWQRAARRQRIADRYRNDGHGMRR